METKQWYLVCYDIMDPKRWRNVFKTLHGYGRPLQYSVFRCRMTRRDAERLRWELERMLTTEDRLLILSVCESCERRIAAQNRPESWQEEPRHFDLA